MNGKLFKQFKNKVVATVALLSFIIIGAGTLMAMKAPNESKAKTPAEKNAVKHLNHHKKTASLYWYPVSYDNPTVYPNGYIKSGTTAYAHAEKSAVTSPCPDGTDADCLRGFASQPSLPNAAPGDDQIQKQN